MPSIFDPITLGRYTLSNRIIMAPMTRGRADHGAVPNTLMAEYYSSRADAGLIITEATAIDPMGYGWIGAPGIWNDAQIAGWKFVTDAVHKKGGKIFLKLWHMGRVSHPDFLNGDLPVGPSEVAAEGESHTPLGKKAYVIPRALTIPQIEEIIRHFAKAADRAIQAGFDGVEIHGANGYLIDQFIRDGSNIRADEYGGTLDNRLRFLSKITKAVTDKIGSDRVGVRLSPSGNSKGMKDQNPIHTFTRAAELLDDFNLAYLHTLEALPGHVYAGDSERVTPYMRKVFKNSIITNGGYDFDLANQAIASGEVDAIAFGGLYISNPDLVKRFQNQGPYNAIDYVTLYTSGPRGYTDYSKLSGS